MPGAVLAQLADVPSTEGYAAVPGGRIYWRRFGSEGATPLLTLHGGPGAAHNYLLSMQALTDRRPVIFYDQLGCGRADAPTDDRLYTIERAVDEVDAVRAALGLQRIVLFGHSWGAMLAIEYLCRGRGQGVERLILGSGFASVAQFNAGVQRRIAEMPGDFATRLHALEAAGLTGSAEYAALAQQFRDRFLRRVPPTPDSQASTQALSRSVANRVLIGTGHFAIGGVLKDWDRRRDLRRITVPTLLTSGAFDEVTLDCQETLRAGLGVSSPHGVDRLDC